MSIGQGTPGLKDSLRDFIDLVESDAAERRVVATLEPTFILDPTKWVLHSGAIYKQEAHYVLAEAVRDVSGVRCQFFPYELGREERVSGLAASRYVFDPDAIVIPPTGP